MAKKYKLLQYLLLAVCFAFDLFQSFKLLRDFDSIFSRRFGYIFDCDSKSDIIGTGDWFIVGRVNNHKLIKIKMNEKRHGDGNIIHL